MNSKVDVVENTIPVLPVKDLAAAVRFYTEMLEFIVDWETERVASVSLSGHSIMLSTETGATGPGWVWIGLQNDSLFDAYRTRGVTIHQEAKNRPWAWEIKFLDLDSNVLWLGTASRSDIPISGG